MITKYAKRGLVPAVGIAFVLAAAFVAPARGFSIGGLFASYGAVCYSYPACGIYTGDAFGPLHPDQASPQLSNNPVFGSPLVRAAHFAPAGTGVKPPYSGMVLDAYGGLHGYNSNGSVLLSVGQEPYYPGFDIARDFVFLPNGNGGYELDGYGGIHPFSLGSGALPPAPGQYPYYPGQDLAKKITILSTGLGGYELDAYGGIHPWSVGSNPLPAQITQEPYYPGNNIARDLWLDPLSTGASSSGYELDGYGGFHPWSAGAAALPLQMFQYPYYPGNDIARIMWFQPNASANGGSAGYQLDGFGGIHPFCTQGTPLPPAFGDYAYWPGRDIARALFGA